MKKPFFVGVCTALVTPFYYGNINYLMLEQLIQRQINAGIRSIVICGTTGEAPVLSDDEKYEMFCKSRQYAGERCQIIAGTGSNSTAHAVELSIRAEAAGADGLLVVSPYYNKSTAKGLITHYSMIAESVHIPIIIYNVPSRTGLDIPIDVYKELSNIPNIAGAKEASSDITKFTKILASCPSHFSVWSGNDDMAVPVMALGGSGVISVTSNVDPVRMRMLTDAALSGEYKTAAAIQMQLLKLNQLLFSEVNPIPAKEAMRCIGYDCGNCRLPLTKASIATSHSLREYLINQPPLVPSEARL